VPVVDESVDRRTAPPDIEPEATTELARDGSEVVDGDPSDSAGLDARDGCRREPDASAEVALSPAAPPPQGSYGEAEAKPVHDAQSELRDQTPGSPPVISGALIQGLGAAGQEICPVTSRSAATIT
jgi:hypothetical protein